MNKPSVCNPAKGFVTKPFLVVPFACLTACLLWGSLSQAASREDPESVLRALVRANAEMDLHRLSELIAHDEDIPSYSIGGRKYVGWPALAREFQTEFASVDRLELPIHELKVWKKHDLAWFTMELDYIRYLGQGESQQRQVLPLRESGLMEYRQGQWQLLSWHESMRRPARIHLVSASGTESAPIPAKPPDHSAAPAVDLSGVWDITEVEDDKHYQATLDVRGNGPYTQHEGRFVTTQFADRKWQGTWHQPGNDREGGFDLLLSEDGMQANGVWWYSRVGTHKNIPPREHGGTYLWKRRTSGVQ